MSCEEPRTTLAYAGLLETRVAALSTALRSLSLKLDEYADAIAWPHAKPHAEQTQTYSDIYEHLRVLAGDARLALRAALERSGAAE